MLLYRCAYICLLIFFANYGVFIFFLICSIILIWSYCLYRYYCTFFYSSNAIYHRYMVLLPVKDRGKLWIISSFNQYLSALWNDIYKPILMTRHTVYLSESQLQNFTIEETNWSTLSPYVVRGSTPQALANVSFYSDHLISLCSLITLFLLKLYIRITVINMFIRSSAVHDSFTTIILQNVSRFSKNCETNGLEYCFLKKYFLSTLCHAMFVPGYLTRLS